MASASVAQPRDVLRGSPAGLAMPPPSRGPVQTQQTSSRPQTAGGSALGAVDRPSRTGAVKTPPELPVRPVNKKMTPSSSSSSAPTPHGYIGPFSNAGTTMTTPVSSPAPTPDGYIGPFSNAGTSPLSRKAATTAPALPVRVPKKKSVAAPPVLSKMPSSSKPSLSPVQHDRKSYSASSTSMAATTSGSNLLPVPRGKSIVDPKTSSDAPRTLSQRVTNMIQRRPSAVNQDSTTTTTNSNSIRRPSLLPSVLRKKSSAEEDESVAQRRNQMLSGQNSNANMQLSMRLSFARGSVTDQALAKPGASRKKSDAIVFTKKEMRSIRMAATEAKGINWDEDESRTSDDTTSLYSGGEDADPKKRPTLVLNVDSVYKQNKETGKKMSRNGSFEFINPNNQNDSQHFGMFIFSAATDSTLHEEDDED